MEKPITAPPDIVNPDYNIYKFTDSRYKVVRFKSTDVRAYPRLEKAAEGFKHEKKLSQAISRAKRICLEIAICNDWKWFATLTIAKNNYDRENLDGFYKRFYSWIKEIRKSTGKKIPYLLVPEQHADGAWHMHGFFNSDIDEFLVSFRDLDSSGYVGPEGKRLPRRLINKNYYSWERYRKKFGFCSFGEIRNQAATAFYCVKYISKSFSGGAPRVGLNLYYRSLGLNTASYYDSVYGRNSVLDSCLTNHYEFCSTGFWCFNRQPGDDPLLDILEEQQNNLFAISFDLADDPELAAEVDEYYSFNQSVLEGF